MKKIISLSIVLLTIITTKLNAQTACSEYKGDYNLIRNALIERAKAADLYKPTASSQENRIKGWGDASINFLAEKWVAICRCNEGVTKEVFDKEIYGKKSDNSLLINASPPDDRYFYDNQQGMKDLSIFKDLNPPNRIYISSDCVKGQSNIPAITHTDCWNHPDYKVDPKEDPQGYIKTFKMAECMCKGGVQTQQEAETLYRQMLDAYNSYKTYYPNSKVVLNKPSGPEICSKMVLDANGNPVITTQSQVNLVYTGYESNAEKFRDEYIKTFSTPNEFNAYASGMNVKRVGEALAKDLANNLNQIQGLVNTTDPLVLLQDFNQKVMRIESLEANFNEQFNSYSFQTGQQLGTSIGNKDYESALFQGLGLLNASLEKREAQKQMEAQMQALHEERRSQMSRIYWKAVDYNNSIKQTYIRRSAFSEKLEDEKFNLAFADNLNCHNASMKKNFSVSHTGWLENKCFVPKKTDVLNLLPTNTSKDLFYLALAEHKFKQFEKLGYIEFQEAAIHYTAQAITIKPTAERFVALARYYKGFSDIYELSNYLAAQSYNKNVLNNEQIERVEWLKLAVEEHLTESIHNSDLDFVSLFMDVGFDKLISIKGIAVLDYAISYDKSDVVSKILSFRANSNKEKNASIIESAIMLSIIYDSHLSFENLIKSHDAFSLKIKGKTLKQLVLEMESIRCLSTLIRLSGLYDDVSHFFDGYAIVKSNDKFGVIDTEEKPIITPKYHSLRFPNEGIIIVQNEHKKFGALNLNNELIIPFEHEYLSDCVNGFIMASNSLEKKAYYKSTGEEITSFKYDYADKFYEGFAVVGVMYKGNINFGFIDSNGNEIIQLIYRNAEPFNGGIAKIQAKNFNAGFVNTGGVVFIKPEYEYSTSKVSEGVAMCIKVLKNRHSRACYFYDDKGRLISKHETGFINAYPFNNGFAYIYEDVNGYKQYFIDKYGKKIDFENPLDFTVWGEFKNGLAPIFVGSDDYVSGKYGFINSLGEVVISPIYDQFERNNFIEKKIVGFQYKIINAEITENGRTKFGYLNAKGEVVIPFSYRGYITRSNNIIQVFDKGKVGFIDFEGRFLIPLFETNNYINLLNDPLADASMIKLISWNNYSSNEILLLLNRLGK